MRPYPKAYRYLFLTVAGFALVLALLSLAQGHLLSLVPAALNVFGIAAVATRRRWAHVAVIIWSVPSILAGSAMWLAVLLRGGVLAHPVSTVALRTLLLAVSLFFLWFARSSLVSANNSSKPTPLRGAA